MKKTKIFMMFGLVLLLAGMVLFVMRDRWGSEQAYPNVPAQVTHAPHAPGQQVIEGQPVNLQIPSLNMNLKVIPGVYDAQTQTWTLSLHNVQYATMTPMPNNVEGNTFLYGHARQEVFAHLHNIQPGAMAIIKTTNGHTFYYKYTSNRITNPSDDSLFAYKGKPILTIQTCEGLFYQNRQLFTFDLQRVV